MRHVASRTLGLTLVAGLLAAACGSDSDGDDSAQPEATAPPLPVELPEPEVTSLKVAQSAVPTAGIIHQIVADFLDLDDKYGLDIDWITFSGASQASQALLAGQVDLSDNSGGPVVASLTTDTPQVMTFVTRYNLSDTMFVSGDIQSADDLRGKAVAISSFGSQSHAGALLALESLGLSADDVTITQVGDDNARLAALQAGSVAASMNDAIREDELVDAGFNPLVRLTEVEGLGGVPRTSLTIPVDFVEDNPNTVLRLTAMYMDANLAWRNDPEMAAQALAEAAEMPLEDAQSDIDKALDEPWEPLDGRCNDEVMEFTQQVLVAANPELADVDPTQACTNEFLDQLEELGFQEAIGVPGY